MHRTSNASSQQLDLHLIDPCYHLSDSEKSTSPCPSMLASRSATWTDDVGQHHPDFKPFETTAFPQFYDTTPSPKRRSIDLPRTPTQASRTMAREQLEPSLYAAIRAHELSLKVDEPHQRSESRRSSFLRPCRHRAAKSQEAFSYDDFDDDSSAAYSPPPLPELVFDDASDEEDEEEHTPAEKHDNLRQQIIGLSYRVDLAVFRAKKRLRKRVGLD